MLCLKFCIDEHALIMLQHTVHLQWTHKKVFKISNLHRSPRKVCRPIALRDTERLVARKCECVVQRQSDKVLCFNVCKKSISLNIYHIHVLEFEIPH